ncbi:uncharacterized protein LOC115920172 [Strongylocentrotus purpuratus]|uniref:Uncharacterized protein n=1 Tax=Strongylocentrotus purpuratus TaxID=7668 RepID=A0A7M7SU05_STRPU|nr:uncharacterized protein LOC115920172 [Strongylocentrotus purpuratus]
MPQSFNDGYVDGGANHEAQPGKAARPSGDSHANEAKATPVRRKISIPLVAMITPTRTSLHSSSSGVPSVDKTPQSKATKQGFAQHRTPTGHHGSTKKVKTPLQVTVADKPSTSGTDCNVEHPRPLSTTPAKVSVTRNIVICNSPVVQREGEGESPRPVPDSQEGAGAVSLGILQEGAVQKKMRRGKSGVTTGEGDRDLEDQSKISSAAKSSKEKKGLQNKDLGKASKKDGKTAQAQSKRSSREDSCEAVAVAAQDITDIPDTQSQSLDSEASLESHQFKGRKKGRKAATNPPSEGSKRTTRSSRASQAHGADKASGLSQPLQPESKSRRGKRFKLYSETSLLMDSSESEDMNSGSKTGGKGTKAKRGSDKASDTVRETEEHAVTTSKGKGARTKKGKKKEEKEDLQVTEDQRYKSDKEVESTQMKPKGASKKGRNDITGPLMIEDNLSQDFIVPKATVKGKPTRGVIDLTEDKMTSGDSMYNPDPLEEEEHLTACLPQIDERAAAKALAAENAEYCVPSSAPEERCGSSQDKEEIIPDSQPKKNSFRRSGRFPSPLLSDITEESTMSKGSSGPKLGKRFQSPHTSSQSEDASEPIVIKSRTKPETAKADSTSVNQDEKDPYDFVDSSTVSSLPVVSRKTPPKGGGGDAGSAKAAKKQGGKAVGAKKGKSGHPVTACQDVGVEESSQDDFAIHSHTFGFKNKGNSKSQSRDQGKSQRFAKGLKTSPESDHRQETTEAEDDDLMAPEKPRQSSRRKMKGKLDSDDAYVQRIQRETKELAEFASRMQDQEEEFPDVEVARDVARVTEAYEDTNISTFVKSVMKSLPKHRRNKDILKNATHGEDKTVDRLDKIRGGEVDVEATHAEKEDLEDAEEHSHHRNRRSFSDSRNRSLKSLSKSRDAEVGDEQGTSKPLKKKVNSHADASRKEVLKGAEDKSSRKTTRRASRESIKGDESLTEGEISVDDMVSAHMESILANRSDGMKESAPRKADEDRVKERRMVSRMDALEVNDEVLRRAEDSISRRSKMIVALEHSSVDLSDTEQDKEVEKIQGKRSVEREVSHTSDGTSKRSKQSSVSSIPEDQTPRAPTTKVQSSTGHKERQSKDNQPRLYQSDDGDVYDYEPDLEEIQASKKKTRRDKSEQQKDSFTQKSKTMKPKTTIDDTPMYSAKNRRSMKDSVDLEEARSGWVKPKTVITALDETKRSAAKVSKDSRRHFGSQIEESDSEEIMETETTTSPDDTSTVVSVASFSNMCKDLLKSSGKGIAAGRKRRNVQTVDYRESENSYSGSDDHLDLQTPGRSTTKTACEKPTRDIYEYREETSSCCTASFIEDAISERSWLADRPKQKVSTYSKSRREVFGLTKLTQNLDTVKKPRHKPQVKQNANAPKKRKSQSSKEAEEEELPLYYYAEEEQEAKKAKKQTKRGTQGKEHDDVDRVPSRHEPLSKKVIQNMVTM